MPEKQPTPEEQGGQANDEKQTRAATNEAIDAAAGVPPALRAAAEALPERDPVQKAHKQAALADDAQTEARAKAKLVDESPNAAETPSGHAIKKVAGIGDDVRRGEAYTAEKSAKRWGTGVPDAAVSREGR